MTTSATAVDPYDDDELDEEDLEDWPDPLPCSKPACPGEATYAAVGVEMPVHHDYVCAQH